jgi:hypothetical protein
MKRFWLILVIAVFLGVVGPASADLFVTDLTDNTIEQYTLGSSPGTLAASKQIDSSLEGPFGIAASGNNLFVCNYGHYAVGDTISQYTTSGELVNASLITLAHAPFAVAVSGSDLYVATTDELGNAVIGEYSTSGATVNASLITGVDYPLAMAVYGQNLLVANQYTGTLGPGSVSEYNASTGSLVNKSLITKLNEPNALVVEGSTLYVLNGGDYNESDGSIGQYTLNSDGSVQSADKSFITGIDNGLQMAMQDSDFFVIDDDQNVISEYSTAGALVKSKLVTKSDDDLVGIVSVVPEPVNAAVVTFCAIGIICTVFSRPERTPSSSIVDIIPSVHVRHTALMT